MMDRLLPGRVLLPAVMPGQSPARFVTRAWATLNDGPVILVENEFFIDRRTRTSPRYFTASDGVR